MERFDAIVVGAGAAGCVVARRLVDDGRRVLLVEAGPGRAPASIASIDAVAALDEPAWQWPAVEAVTSDQPHGVAYRRGRGLGGSTAINTLVATPGDRRDYQRWHDELGCAGWDWPSMEQWFALVADEMAPSVVASRGPLASALAPVAADAGHGAGMVSGDLDAVGFLDASLCIGPTGRRSAFDAYLRAADGASASWLDDGRLQVIVDREVQRILVDRGRAVGIELVGGRSVHADLVVVSAGALQTPRLLHRSGVLRGEGPGPAEDHPSFTFTVSLKAGKGRSSELMVPPISALIRWSSAGRGAGAAVGGPQVGVGGVSASNDLMALVMDHVGVGPGGRRFGAVVVALTDVQSRGSLSAATSANRFDPGWLSAASDRRRLAGGVRHIADLLAAPELGSVVDGVYIDDQGTPLAALVALSDVELEQWLRNHPGPVSHVGATLPLGSGDGSVIDLEGAVRGCSGLRVVDASILPHLPNANLQLPVMAVAERLSAALVATT